MNNLQRHTGCDNTLCKQANKDGQSATKKILLVDNTE